MDIEQRIGRLEVEADAMYLALQLIASTLSVDQKSALRSVSGKALRLKQSAFDGKQDAELAVRRLIDSLFT